MLSRIAHHNGTRMPDTPLAVPASATGPSATLLDTFRSPELRRRMCVMMVCWFIVSLAYYGVSLALESLEGSLFVNFFLISLIEFPSYFVTIAVCPPLLVYTNACIACMLILHALMSRSCSRPLCVALCLARVWVATSTSWVATHTCCNAHPPRRDGCAVAGSCR